ncbi:MAG: hypothetical protein JNL32_09590 [Candidatus Kapabacteria bacterium]|nr:hypothetical protein [Candidatus Kapabacteria bacterium]
MIKIFTIEQQRVIVKPITKYRTEHSVLWVSDTRHTNRDSYYYEVVQKHTTILVNKQTYITTHFAGVNTRCDTIEISNITPSSYLELNHLVRQGYTPHIEKSEYDQTPLFNSYEDTFPNYYDQTTTSADYGFEFVDYKGWD